MFTLEPSIPFILLLVTNVLELVGFLSSHMVDNRYLSAVHEGIFQRCTSLRHNMDRFICYWWSSDTFLEDKSKEKKFFELFLSINFLSLWIALIGILFFLLDSSVTASLRYSSVHNAVSRRLRIRLWHLRLLLQENTHEKVPAPALQPYVPEWYANRLTCPARPCLLLPVYLAFFFCSFKRQ